MINKTHYHEYALHAFRNYRIEPISLAEQRDRIATLETLRLLEKDEQVVLNMVYLEPGKPKKSDITNRVECAAVACSMSTATVYRVLAKARRMFAELRELI